MTSAELREFFISAEFQQDLGELSSYMASTAQERPIISMLAKYLWKSKRYKFALENKGTDLFVNEKRIEFKFNYDTCVDVLRKELMTYGDDLRAYAFAASKSNWTVAHKILKDVYLKEPHIFVWIICSRDLRKIAADDGKRIRRWEAWKKLWAERPYDPDGHFLTEADYFLEKLKLQYTRPISILKERILTDGDFRSTYHFRICEFSTTNEEQP